MKLAIDLSRPGKPVRNFWNNMHFHPTDAVEDLWGQEILDRVAADRSAQYVRLYTMFEDVVTRDASGKLVFDFSGQDCRLDYMVSKGFKILLCFNFMPVAMAKTPTELSGRRYKDKHFCRSNPADYNEWKLLCHAQAKHLIDRYGEDEVATWRMHCWNEPDLGYWIYPKFFCDCTPEEREYKMSEYCRLYDFFEAGVHEASPRIQAGGPSCGHYKEFFEYVMRHVSGGRNFVTGAKGTRIDFVSMHCYSSIPQDVHDPYRFKVAPESIVRQYETYRSIMAKYGLGKKPVIIDEWAAAAEGYLGIDKDPRMRFRETEYYAAFYFRLIDLMGQLPQNPERMMICLSGQDRNTRDFDGHRTFFTAHGWSKPLYNAFVLAARLGEEWLPVVGTCPENCGVIASRHPDGRVAVALYNHESDFGREGENAPETVRLALHHLPEKFRVERRRIDLFFSNPFTAWSRLGSPAEPTVWEREQISRRSRPEKCRPDETGSENWDGEAVLLPNSVELLEFIPVSEVR
ncbi:MAG: hypothetical protein IJS14_11185 [Lentisphaeria bacterium]|nr:hypothetical protein [Lentisphaeria bacterium]